MAQDIHIAFAGVTRQWQGKGGVHDISLTIERGQFVSLLGPSGCGKSTTLRLLAGLEIPDAGTIRIDGRDVTHAPPAARALSMVFQSYALFPHLSVADNILFGMKVRRASKAAQADKLSQALEMMDLEGLEDRKPAALSGGQRQRVALARAIVSGHSLCLMDEPLSNLDAKLRHSVRRDIKALQRRLGLTVVYVTHDQSEAMSLSDKIILMRDGRIDQVGPPKALYRRPASVFAAQFIGEPPMTVLKGAALGASDKYRIGIRPEHIRIVREGAGDLRATVREIEYLGASTQILFDHPDARGLVCAASDDIEVAPGHELSLSLPNEHRVLFEDGMSRTEKDPQQNYGVSNRQIEPRDGRKASSSTRKIEEEEL